MKDQAPANSALWPENSWPCPLTRRSPSRGRPPLGLLSALAWLVLASAFPFAAGAQTSGPPQFAVLLPLTGDYAHLGQQLLTAITMALDDEPGVSWTVMDTRGDPETARRRVREIADNPANLAILGPVGREESRAAAAAATASRIPLLALSSADGLETTSCWVFRLRVSPEEEARHLARLASRELGLTRFAVLYPQEPLALDVMRAFVSEVLREGGVVTAVEAYSGDDNQYEEAIELLVNQRYRQLQGRAFSQPPRTRLRRLSSQSTVGFQALFIPDYHDRVGLLLHFLAFYDIPLSRGVQLLGISTWGGSGLRKSPYLVEGALFTQVFHHSLLTARAQILVERYHERLARPPAPIEAEAYDGARLLARILAQNAYLGHDRQAVADAILDTPPREGLSGRLLFDPHGALLRPLTLFSADRDGNISPYQVLRFE